MSMTASEVKNNFGMVMDLVQREPVIVSKSGRESAAILNIGEYQRLLRIENEYWAKRADDAKSSGFVGTEAAADQILSLIQDKS